MFEAAESAGRAAAAARQARGGRGYLPTAAMGGGWNAPTTDQAVMAAQAAGALGSLRPGATANEAILAGQAAGAFDGGIGRSGGGSAPLPDSSNPSSQAYWQRADIRAWEQANPELARRLKERVGFQATPAGGVGGIGPIADGRAYGQQLQSLRGTRGIGPVADGDTYAQMMNIPQQQNQPSQTQGIGPVASGSAYGAQLDAMQGTSGMGPLADPETYGAMLNQPDEQRRRAAALSSSYLRAIQQRGAGAGQ